MASFITIPDAVSQNMSFRDWNNQYQKATGNNAFDNIYILKAWNRLSSTSNKQADTNTNNNNDNNINNNNYNNSQYDYAAAQARAQAEAKAKAEAKVKAEVDLIMSNMGNLDKVLANRNKTAQDTYNQARKSYDDTFALDRQARDKAVTQNEQANTDARQAAMVQAAVGGRGLRSVLASMGALGGTGLDLANQAVAREANIDIGNADKNFQTNAGNITDSWARAEDEDRRRRAEAITIRDNSLTNNAADVAASRQSMYNQLAGMYDRGTAEANKYLAKSAALAPKIAAGSKQAVAPYAKSQQLFAPGKLQEYLGGVRDLSVGASAAPSGQTSLPINSPLFGQLEDKRRQIGVA